MSILDVFQTFLSGTFAFIVLLGLLIFVHELGHFSVARWCGVRVETFSLGFGKKIWSKKRGDTTYCVSAIPFGGYVKMFGDQPGADVPESERAFSFTHKSVWQRMAIVLAGPLVNLIFAFFVFFAMTLIGEELPPSKLGDVSEDTKAYSLGFRSGDEILQVNGHEVPTLEELSDKLTAGLGSQNLFKVRRGSEVLELTAAVESPSEKELLEKHPLASGNIGTVPGFSFVSKGTVVGVPHSSLAHKIGLRTGDQIVKIRDSKIAYWRDLEREFLSVPEDTKVQISVKRKSEPSSPTEELSFDFLVQNGGALEDLGLESPELYLARVVPDSPAATAGLAVGDRILAIDDVAMKRWEDVLTAIKSFSGKNSMSFRLLRDGQEKQMSITPKMTSQPGVHGLDEKRYTIGISPIMNLVGEEAVKHRTLNPIKGLTRSFDRTYDSTVLMVHGLLKLVSGEISPKNIGGVISIGQAAHESFKRGLSYYLHLMAMLSINLFILNLLPVPVLDGGHLVFYCVEAIKGSPVRAKTLEIAQQVGMALLLFLMVYALYNDVSKLFV